MTTRERKARVMNVFGEYSGLSDEVTRSLENIISQISDLEEDKKEDVSIFYGYPLIQIDKQDSLVKGCIITRKGLIALYEFDSEKNVYSRHFVQLIMESPKLSDLYLNGLNPLKILKIDNVRAIIDALNTPDILEHEDYLQFVGIIQHAYGLNKSDDRNLTSEETLGAIIKKRTNAMNMLDQNQFNGIYNKIGTHLRIRGLAGSGKTILLVKKMAYAHFKNRDLDLAYVFYTKSLKQYIEALFKLYYKDFEKYQEPDMSKIHILHSWGGNEMKGFYSDICMSNGYAVRTYAGAKNLPGEDKFDAVCHEIVAKGENLNKDYNYIFVDEAQDFKLNFFKMALRVLKYTGKLIYAYDELQSLNSSTEMPSKMEIFGTEECEDINLSVCYRTPKEILVTAHALGLGIYQVKDGKPKIVNMMEDYSIWNAVGYHTKAGTLGYGKHVVLDRDEVIEYKPEECVEIESVPSTTDQYTAIAKEIIRLVDKEDVIPEDILIIDLSTLNLQNDYAEFRKSFFEVLSDESNLEYKLHLVNKDNAIAFKRKGSIPFTTIFRAKGNEANIVFVINAHKMSSMMAYSRNRLFTAMTRAKFKTYVYGVESDVMSGFKSEYEMVKQKGYTLDFVYPTKPELEKMQNIAKVETERMETIQKVYKDVGKDTEVTIEVLKEQTGASSIEELIAILQRHE